MRRVDVPAATIVQCPERILEGSSLHLAMSGVHYFRFWTSIEHEHTPM
jgi:hypothetical protein